MSLPSIALFFREIVLLAYASEARWGGVSLHRIIKHPGSMQLGCFGTLACQCRASLIKHSSRAKFPLAS